MKNLLSKPLHLLVLTMCLTLVVVGCGAGVNVTDKKLKVGILPIIDCLPLWVAERNGYFADEGVQVELVNFASAMERDVALQAGQLDGELNDPISVGLLNKERAAVKIVRLTYQGNEGLPMISVVVGPDSKAKNLADLKGGDLALSQNTVIEYVADTLMRQGGVSVADVKKTEVSKIPLRLEMLAKGQVAAAGLPEPFTSLAIRQGGHVLASDGRTGVGQSTLVFRSEAIAQKSTAIKRLLAAYERAVKEISRDPQSYREILVDQAKVPDAVKDSFPVPQLPKASVPKEEDLRSAFEWMAAKGLISRVLSFGEVVDASLLPK